MLRYSCVVLLLAALLMPWCGEVDAAPSFSSNGTSISSNLTEADLQQKINALDVPADYIAIAGNVSDNMGSTNCQGRCRRSVFSGGCPTGYDRAADGTCREIF